jgi:hypothetical protein
MIKIFTTKVKYVTWIINKNNKSSNTNQQQLMAYWLQGLFSSSTDILQLLKTLATWWYLHGGNGCG